jgi:ABC-type branched-subunit amino acid transport system substrate-binding protein
MREDRRRLLRSLGSGLVASSCPSFLSVALAAKRIAPAALIVPLSGADAAIGRSMARAAALAQADPKSLFVIDSGATPASAAVAARDAIKRGAGLILGPLRSGQVRAVVGGAGQIPVIAFSNDTALLDSGAFLLGITADQSVAPLLHYAHSRGIRRIAVVGGDPWATAAARAGQREGLGIETVSPEAAAALARSADPPHAILFCGTPPAGASDLRNAGVQPLVAFTGLDPSPQAVAALEGAWLSAPDPTAFADFANAYEGANGAPPGILAGLAHDGAAIASTLARGGGSDRSALLAATRFEGVCGDIRFRTDGSASRDMAILTVAGGRYQMVDHSGIA